MLRAFVGTSAESSAKPEDAERLIVLETNIDDMSPQIAGYLLEKLLKAGALDCFFTPVVMKKTGQAYPYGPDGRALQTHSICDIQESTSIGVRIYRSRALPPEKDRHREDEVRKLKGEGILQGRQRRERTTRVRIREGTCVEKWRAFERRSRCRSRRAFRQERLKPVIIQSAID